MDRTDHPSPQHSPRAHRDDVPALPKIPRPGVAPTANARTCDECGTTYSGESCPSCRTPSAASYVRATAGSAA